jgi:hypothetical protein
MIQRKIKALFIHDRNDMNLEQVIGVAKEQAERAHMGESQFIQVLDMLWSAKCEGWSVLVEYRI